MIVLTRVRMCAQRASFVLRMGSVPTLMVSLELAQSVSKFYYSSGPLHVTIGSRTAYFANNCMEFKNIT